MLPHPTYRKALGSDIDYLLLLRKATMDEHLTAAAMPITDEEHLKRIHYHYEGALIIMLDGESVGLLKMRRDENCIEIIQIQIDPKQQGKGIGKRVILSVIEQAKNLSVKLSVLKQNKARGLYESLGFCVVGEDRDSFLMKR